MKNYMMDSNALAQSQGQPFQVKSQKSKDKREICFSFARGTPVIANRRSGKSLLVIPSPPAGGEESVPMKQISPFVRNDRKEQPVRDRPLFMLRDGPSWMIRGTPRWFARGKPPARSEPKE